jgi:hypothetical protein
MSIGESEICPENVAVHMVVESAKIEQRTPKLTSVGLPKTLLIAARIYFDLSSLYRQ